MESGRTMSWATPVRSHVVVKMMARSITVERSVPALLGLARVSGLGMGMGMGMGMAFYLVLADWLASRSPARAARAGLFCGRMLVVSNLIVGRA